MTPATTSVNPFKTSNVDQLSKKDSLPDVTGKSACNPPSVFGFGFPSSNDGGGNDGGGCIGLA